MSAEHGDQVDGRERFLFDMGDVESAAKGAAVGLLAAAEAVIKADRTGLGEIDVLADAALLFALVGTVAGWHVADEWSPQSQPGRLVLAGGEGGTAEAAVVERQVGPCR